MICENCNSEHAGSYGSGRFCCEKCARGFSTKANRKEINRKVSNTLLVNYIKKHTGILSNIKYNTFCKACGKKISNKTTSFLCVSCVHKTKEYKDKISKSLKGKTGGYKKGSGRSFSGYYKNIYCGSTYELVWVIYRLDHNLPVKRFKGYLKNNNLIYYPDFIDNNKIIEIKGYHTDTVDKKANLAKEYGFEIDILYKEDLTFAFNWVKNNYYYKKLQELYDNYKPKYEYICNNCYVPFSKDVKVHTELKFCCRSCVGKYRIKQKAHVD